MLYEVITVQPVARLLPEKIRRRRVAAVEDPFRILDRHLLDRVDEDRFCLRGGFFRRAIHAESYNFV